MADSLRTDSSFDDDEIIDLTDVVEEGDAPSATGSFEDELDSLLADDSLAEPLPEEEPALRGFLDEEDEAIVAPLATEPEEPEAFSADREEPGDFGLDLNAPGLDDASPSTREGETGDLDDLLSSLGDTEPGGTAVTDMAEILGSDDSGARTEDLDDLLAGLGTPDEAAEASAEERDLTGLLGDLGEEEDAEERGAAEGDEPPLDLGGLGLADGGGSLRTDAVAESAPLGEDDLGAQIDAMLADAPAPETLSEEAAMEEDVAELLAGLDEGLAALDTPAEPTSLPAEDEILEHAPVAVPVAEGPRVELPDAVPDFTATPVPQPESYIEAPDAMTRISNAMAEAAAGVDALRTRLDGLEDRLADLDAAMAAPAPAAPDLEPALAALREQADSAAGRMDSLEERIGGYEPAGSVAAAVAALTERLEDDLSTRASADSLEELSARLSGLEEKLAQVEVLNSRMDGLDERLASLDALAGRMEELSAKAAAADALAARMEALEASAAAALERTKAIDALDAAVAGIKGQVAAIDASAHSRVVEGKLTRALEEDKAALTAALAERDAEASRLRERVAFLEEQFAAAAPANPDEIAGLVRERLAGELETGLDQRIAAACARILREEIAALAEGQDEDD